MEIRWWRAGVGVGVGMTDTVIPSPTEQKNAAANSSAERDLGEGQEKHGAERIGGLPLRNYIFPDRVVPFSWSDTSYPV